MPPPAPAAGAGTGAAAVPRQRPQEVVDEDEEDDRLADEGREAADSEPELTCRLVWDGSSRRLTTSAAAAAASISAAPMGGDVAAGAVTCEEEEAPSVRLKERGNALLKTGDYAAALQCYDDALAACCSPSARPPPLQQQQQLEHRGQPELIPQPPQQQRQPGGRHRLHAALHSNRAHALLKLKRPADAATSALKAHQLHPTWTKPLYRSVFEVAGRGGW